MRRKKSLPIEVHQEVGRKLAAMTDELTTLMLTLQEAYGKTFIRQLDPAFRSITRVRMQLDDRVNVEYPTLPTARVYVSVLPDADPIAERVAKAYMSDVVRSKRGFQLRRRAAIRRSRRRRAMIQPVPVDLRRKLTF